MIHISLSLTAKQAPNITALLSFFCVYYKPDNC